MWRNYLKPRIGRLIVRTFERKDAHQLWEKIHAENPQLRKRTMIQIRSVANNVFKWALDRGLYYGDNPAKASLTAGLPGPKDSEAYSMAEIAAMLKASIDPKVSAVLALLFGSGNRMSEVRGTCCEDYERKETGAVIHLHQQFNDYGWQPLKTEKSKGDIELGEAFAVHIDNYRATLPEGADSGPMFPGRRPDKPMDLYAFADFHIKPLLKPLGIPWRNGFHAFRRCNSTFVAKAVNSEAAAEHSRHTVEIAEAAYIKMNDQERRGAQAAKVASIESKRAELRKAAAGALAKGLKSETSVQ